MLEIKRGVVRFLRRSWFWVRRVARLSILGLNRQDAIDAKQEEEEEISQSMEFIGKLRLCC